MAVRPEKGESDSEDGDDGAGMAGAEGEKIKAEKEAEVMKTLLDPLKPTEQAVEDHNRTHMPSSTCCSHSLCPQCAADCPVPDDSPHGTLPDAH